MVNQKKCSTFAPGEMAEWSIAAVLKTVELRGSGGSNPSLSARPTSKRYRKVSLVFLCYSKKTSGDSILSLFFVKVSVELKLISLLLTYTKMRQSLAMFSCVESGITHLNTGVAEQDIFNFQRCSASASPSESLITKNIQNKR